MAEKKRGFHALEQRIHQIEEEDAKQQGSVGERKADAPQAQPGEKGTGGPKKK